MKTANARVDQRADHDAGQAATSSAGGDGGQAQGMTRPGEDRAAGSDMETVVGGAGADGARPDADTMTGSSTGGHAPAMADGAAMLAMADGAAMRTGGSSAGGAAPSAPSSADSAKGSSVGGMPAGRAAAGEEMLAGAGARGGAASITFNFDLRSGAS